MKTPSEIIAHFESMIQASNEILNTMLVEVETANVMRKDQEFLREAIVYLKAYDRGYAKRIKHMLNS